MPAILNPKEQERVDDLLRTLNIVEEAHPEWSEFDDNMSALNWLGDDETFREASYIQKIHVNSNPQCPDHAIPHDCNIPKFIKCVDLILGFYEHIGEMPKSYRYILQYYIAIVQLGEIKF